MQYLLCNDFAINFVVFTQTILTNIMTRKCSVYRYIISNFIIYLRVIVSIYQLI